MWSLVSIQHSLPMLLATPETVRQFGISTCPQCQSCLQSLTSISIQKISFSTLEKLLSIRSLAKDFSQIFQISVWQAAYRDFFFNIHSLIINILKNLKNDPINISDIMPRTNFILNRTLFHNRLSAAFLLLI